MNKEKLMGVVRHILTFGGGYVVAQGWLDESTVAELVGATVTVIGVAWSYFSPEKQVS